MFLSTVNLPFAKNRLEATPGQFPLDDSTGQYKIVRVGEHYWLRYLKNPLETQYYSQVLLGNSSLDPVSLLDSPILPQGVFRFGDSQCVSGICQGFASSLVFDLSGAGLAPTSTPSPAPSSTVSTPPQ